MAHYTAQQPEIVMCTMSRRLLGIKEEGGASYKTWVGYKLSVGAAPDAHQTSARKTMFARRCPPQLQQGRCLGSCMPSRSSSSAGTRRGAPQRFSRRISALGDVEDLTLSSDLCLLWPLGVPKAGFQIWAESCFAETRDPDGYLRRKRNRIPSSAASCNPY